MSSNSTTNTKSEKIMPHLSSFRWLKQLAIIFDKKTGQHPFLKSKIFVYLIPISFSIKFKQTQNFSFSDKIGQNYKHDSSGLEIPLVALLSLKFHNFYTVKTKSMRYAIRINQWSVTQLLVWPQWRSFADWVKRGFILAKESVKEFFFWFDFHRCSHGSSKSD